MTEWLMQWLEQRAGKLRHRSVANNRYLLTKHVLPVLGEGKLNEITEQMIESLYRDLMGDKGLSAATAHRVHAALADPFQCAFRDRIIFAKPHGAPEEGGRGDQPLSIRKIEPLRDMKNT